jgi:hypothetical protein
MKRYRIGTALPKGEEPAVTLWVMADDVADAARIERRSLTMQALKHRRLEFHEPILDEEEEAKQS